MTLQQTRPHLSADNMRATELEERIRRFLRTRGVDGIDNIEITLDGRTVVLSGVIDDPESKRRCVECCRHVVGVAEVVNQLRLKTEAEHARPKTSPRMRGARPC